MKKIIILALALTAVFVISECSGPKEAITKAPETKTESKASENALLDIAKKTWPNATVASLAEGQTIYTTKCNKCHGLYPIVGRSEESWKHEIKSMAPKARLTPEETELLSQYLLSARQLN
ncbi:MAG: hypothetical protein HYZ42_16875 [Bacteroidetes bacterium]|nr:hypothetical protein [Bacteroidota bacterium]